MIPFYGSVVLALLTTITMIPAWIKLCIRLHLFERTDSRKTHMASIPSMGGIAIYAGIMVSFFSFGEVLPGYNTPLLFTALALMLFTGAIDDLFDLPAWFKLLLQLLAAALAVHAGFKISSLFGFMGLQTLPYPYMDFVSVVFILAVTNALNLIDGIDGLAGSLTISAALIFSMLFLQAGEPAMAIIPLSVCGAVAGFLVYNITPARIFMGDSGSLVLGFLLAVLAIALARLFAVHTEEFVNITPSVLVAALFIPLYDVVRVVVIRMFSGTSPFRADRNHLHHLLLQHGFSQRMAMLLLIVLNLLLMVSALLLPEIGLNHFILFACGLGVVLMNSWTIAQMARWYKRMGGRLYNLPAAA